MKNKGDAIVTRMNTSVIRFIQFVCKSLFFVCLLAKKGSKPHATSAGLAVDPSRFLFEAYQLGLRSGSGFVPLRFGPE